MRTGIRNLLLLGTTLGMLFSILIVAGVVIGGCEVYTYCHEHGVGLGVRYTEDAAALANAETVYARRFETTGAWPWSDYADLFDVSGGGFAGAWLREADFDDAIECAVSVPRWFFITCAALAWLACVVWSWQKRRTAVVGEPAPE